MKASFDNSKNFENKTSFDLHNAPHSTPIKEKIKEKEASFDNFKKVENKA